MTALPHTRRGFSLVEAVVALAVLAIAAVLVAEFATWSLAERGRTDARLEALTAATNVLEEARAKPWDELTPEWAAARKLPAPVAARWSDCKLTVKVVAEADRPRVKRVTAEVAWTDPKRALAPVALTALLAARTPEGKP